MRLADFKTFIVHDGYRSFVFLKLYTDDGLTGVGEGTVVQPDLCHAGGLTEVKKIAAMAEAAYVQVAPHSASGPIGTAAAVHLDAVIPNFLIQEFFVTQAPWIEDVVEGGPRVETGEIVVSDRPGLGVELHEAAAGAHPFREYFGGKTLFSAGWQASLPDDEALRRG